MTQPNNQTLTERTRPDLAQAVAQMNQAILLEGLLPAELKQRILLDIVLHEGNTYTDAFPAMSLTQFGLSPDLIAQAQQDESWSDAPAHYQTFLSYARQTAQTPKLMSKADQQPLHEAGLDEGAMIELSMVAVLANFLSTWLAVPPMPDPE